MNPTAMQPQSRLRRAVKRATWFSMAAVAIAWLASTVATIEASTRESPSAAGAAFTLRAGNLLLMTWPQHALETARSPYTSIKRQDFQASLRLPAIYSSSGAWIAIIPLWLPFLPIALTSAYLWYRDRRRPAPDQCKHCNYDLTGNISGTCPECGQTAPKTVSP